MRIFETSVRDIICPNAPIRLGSLVLLAILPLRAEITLRPGTDDTEDRLGICWKLDGDITDTGISAPTLDFWEASFALGPEDHNGNIKLDIQVRHTKDLHAGENGGGGLYRLTRLIKANRIEAFDTGDRKVHGNHKDRYDIEFVGDGFCPVW